jgi:Zn-dependent peptidase ImmA (M78 family)/transcriptional regulator with XRE-family HTH domain
MTTGTPGFIGERLKQAREARGLTTVVLAELVGVTRAAISLYENGNATPQLEILEELANKLNMPFSFFLKPMKTDTNDTIFYRSLSSTTKMARASAKRRYEWLSRDIVPFVNEYVNYPAPNVRIYSYTLGEISDRRIEEIAMQIRNEWGLGTGPISNTTLLFENNGIIISKIELCEPNLDAFSTWNNEDGRPYIVANIDKHSAVRWRFNISHELGHLIMHRYIDDKQLANLRNFKIIEQQAHRFAGAFLLPAESFVKDVYIPTLDVLKSLKPKWKVSIGVMIKRLENLNIISDEEARRLWINYNRRRWRIEEPLDNEIPFEQPRLLRKALELIGAEISSPEQIQEQLALKPREIRELTNVMPDFFKEDMPQVILKELPTTDNNKILDEANTIIDNYLKNNDY